MVPARQTKGQKPPMRILCSTKEHQLEIRPLGEEYRVLANNQTIKVITASQIVLVFKPYYYLYPYERLIAAQIWNGATKGDLDPSFAAYGASPQMIAPTVEGGMAWQWWMNLSVFDTEWLDDEEQRE